jgi:hypothetical protein
LSTKIEQLQWRRSKVVEMRARGMSQARRDLDKNSFESKDQNLSLINGSIIAASLSFLPSQIMSINTAMN